MNKELEINESKTLALFIDVNPVEFLEADNLQSVLDTLGNEVRSEIHNINTIEGRDSLSSHVGKIKKSITFIEKAALLHARELKLAPSIFDVKRKLFKDFMGDLKDELIKPLNEWNEAEEKKIIDLNNKVISFRITDEDGALSAGLETMQGVIDWVDRVNSTDIDDTFGDRKDEAKRIKDASMLIVDGLIAKYQKEADDAARAEEDRLKREAEAKAEYEAKVEREAKERAEANAKEAIEAEQRKAEQARIDADNAEKQRAAQAIIDKDNAVKAESERLKKIADDKEMEEKLRLDKLAQSEAKKKAAALKKSESQNHRNKVRTAIKESVAAAGLGADAFVLIRMIDEGKIPHITVNYG